MNDRPKTARVYIDGFNLYYGILKDSPHWKWLDLQALSDRLLNQQQVDAVTYCTAKVTGQAKSRQKAYLRALDTLDRVNVVYGHFKRKEITCRSQTCFQGGSTFWTQEEKGSDVNLALSILDDAHHNRMDTAVLISGDTDLVPAVEKAKAASPNLDILVYIPVDKHNPKAMQRLRAFDSKSVKNRRDLPTTVLRACQLPQVLQHPQHGDIRRPNLWS